MPGRWTAQAREPAKVRAGAEAGPGRAWRGGRGARLPQARSRASRAGVGWCGRGGCDVRGGRCGFQAVQLAGLCLP